jgi:hypothetical protein
MPGVNISVDVGPMVQWLTDLQSEQIPFATSRAVNDLAKEVQAAIQEGMKQRFIIRRDWVLQGVRISKFSDKHDTPIMATIDIAPDRRFLPKFEEGDTKYPRFGTHIAVPTPAIRVSGSGVIPVGWRPKSFGFAETTTKRGAVQIKGDRRTFILLNTASPGIYQRTGPGARAIKMLYKFFVSVPTPRSLHFKEGAQKVCTARFRFIFKKRLGEALATAKPGRGG